MTHTCLALPCLAELSSETARSSCGWPFILQSVVVRKGPLGSWLAKASQHFSDSPILLLTTHLNVLHTYNNVEMQTLDQGEGVGFTQGAACKPHFPAYAESWRLVLSLCSGPRWTLKRRWPLRRLGTG